VRGADATNVTGFSEELGAHGAWEFDLATSRIRWSNGVYRIHGVSRKDFQPTVDSVRELVHPDDLLMYRSIVQKATENRTPFTVQHRLITPAGRERTVCVRGAFMAGTDGDDRLIGTTQDVTGRASDDELLWHMANEDPLTGLFNRRRFMEELAREVAVAKRSGEGGAVLIIDIDRFKEINDILGHSRGDGLLERIAQRLRERLRGTDTLARLGGDEFAIVLPRCPIAAAERVGHDLAIVVRETPAARIGGRDRHVAISVGVARFGQDADRTPTELLMEADLAMYRAKAQGGNGVEVFDEAMRAELAAKVRVEGELREALDRDELEIFYQPLASLADGTVVGCEALLRWHHPERGLVGPGEFIPIAEEYGLISRMGKWVLEGACRQARTWRDQGRNLYVSVNVSPVQLIHDDVPAQVAALLKETRLPPQLLHIEVTETSILDEGQKIAPALEAVRALGVRVAIDDFGGGSSSLSRLRVLPIDTIKIDRVFIQGLPDRSDDRAIVAAVLSLGEELGLSVIAEGVETERQHWELHEQGCRYAQGFLYAQPRTVSELELDGYVAVVQPGIGDPSVIREFMRQIGIPAARVGAPA
jgi:diguanylate cyclase (GGDEF)-like protein